MKAAVRALSLWIASLSLMSCQVITGLSQLEVVSEDGGAGDGGSSSRGPELDASDTLDSSFVATRDAEPADAPERASECPLADGAACDLVRQCGCGAGLRCQAVGETGEPSCTPPGSLPSGSACRSADACPAGQTCDDGVCRTYCQDSTDCANGTCVPTRSREGKPNGPSVCLQSCEIARADSCPDGTLCSDTTRSGEAAAAHCIAPMDPCPSVEDGTCDEAAGTGRCAEGSDAKDCGCKPSLPGAACDLVAQCGCAQGHTCLPEAGGAVCAAARAGATEVGELCRSNDECRAGLACNYGTCQPFCATDRECPEGDACRDVYADDGTPVPGVRLCVTSCDRASAANRCKPGTTCVELDGRFPMPGSFCAVPLPECEGPIVADLVCDEPEGTGLCAEGEDPVACCRITRPGAECDPVEQCGCEAQPETSCQHVHLADDSFSASCLPHGTVAADRFCVVDDKCAAGSLCVDHVCRPYCADQSQCSGGVCSRFFSAGLEVSDLGVCMRSCTDDQSCEPQTSCVMGDAGMPRACQFQPFAECPYRSDGECDEPGGTDLCLQGSDPEDCSAAM